MKKLFYLLIFLFITGCSNSRSPGTINELQQEVQNILNNTDGEFGLAFKNLADSSETILINADERFHAASTMKTPVLIEIYRQAEEGKFALSDSIKVINTFKSILDGSPYTMGVSEDSEQDLYHRMNKKATIYDLAYQMITQSSNLATNILIEHVEAKKVTQTMRELGADSIEVLRGVEDLKAYEAGLNNTTTARDLMIMFEELEKGTLLNEESKDQVIEILKDQKHNDMFPVKLPNEAEIAHKTGWITNTYHDSGIIYLPDGKAFVLVLLSKNTPDRVAVQNAAAEIALLTYRYIESQP